MLSSQHHADSAAVRPRHVDDVGDLAGPVDEAAVDVDAQVVQLQALTGSAHGARHYSHTLRGRQHGVKDGAADTSYLAALTGNSSFVYLVSVLLSTADDILLGVNPVQLFVLRVVVDGADVPQAVDGQDDVRTLLLVDHHTVDGRFLAEQQEGRRS